eukprot:m.204572 g.204572  ORF g.204572 m.204572 type:complete len:373 (+) comp26034_c0_seq1:860-1978(+)
MASAEILKNNINTLSEQLLHLAEDRSPSAFVTRYQLALKLKQLTDAPASFSRLDFATTPSSSSYGRLHFQPDKQITSANAMLAAAVTFNAICPKKCEIQRAQDLKHVPLGKEVKLYVVAKAQNGHNWQIPEQEGNVHNPLHVRATVEGISDVQVVSYTMQPDRTTTEICLKFGASCKPGEAFRVRVFINSIEELHGSPLSGKIQTKNQPQWVWSSSHCGHDVQLRSGRTVAEGPKLWQAVGVQDILRSGRYSWTLNLLEGGEGNTWKVVAGVVSAGFHGWNTGEHLNRDQQLWGIVCCQGFSPGQKKPLASRCDVPGKVRFVLDVDKRTLDYYVNDQYQCRIPNYYNISSPFRIAAAVVAGVKISLKPEVAD